MLSYRGHAGGVDLKVHSRKRYRDRAILRLLPDHLLKLLHMIQRLTGCREMGNLVFKVQGTVEMKRCSSPHTLPESHCSVSVQRARRRQPFPIENTRVLSSNTPTSGLPPYCLLPLVR